MKTLVCFLAAAVLLSAGACAARTWGVKKDGSGDFTVIQDAIDVADSGDTIEIGPGRFDAFHWHLPGGWMIGNIDSKNLIIIGSGSGETVIGPTEYGIPEADNVHGFVVTGMGVETRIRDIGFENLAGTGVHLENSGRLELDDCRFQNCIEGVFGVMGDGGWIRSSEFLDFQNDAAFAAIVLYSPVVDAEVSNCRFTNCKKSIGCYWAGVEGVVIRDCEIIGGHSGIAFKDGASGRILDCQLSGLEAWGILIFGNGDLAVENCSVSVTGHLFGSCFAAGYGAGGYTLRGNVFSTDMGIIIRMLTPYGNISCSENYFIREGPEAWYILRPNEQIVPPFYPVRMDFTGNWWGTNDPEEVAAWIWDANDEPHLNIFFDYLPMADDPVSVKTHSLSGVKEMFR